MRISRPLFAMVVMVAALSGCRGCDEPYQRYLAKMGEREGVCYAMPVREAAAEVRAALAEEKFPLPPETGDDPALIVTGWKDTTVGGSRLTFPGRPARARREVLLAGNGCLRFAVRVVAQSTPKDGHEYAETRYDPWLEEGDLTIAIHERLKAHARPWQPPASP
jgi:hypothetical protein